jgi:hypothetical protein
MIIRTCQLSQFREENIKSEQLSTGVEMLSKRMNTTVQAVYRGSRFCSELPTFRFSERFGNARATEATAQNSTRRNGTP